MQINLSSNKLCGVWGESVSGCGYYTKGTYNGEGIKAIADAMRVSHSLNSIDVGYNDIDQAAALELLAVMKEKAMVSIGMAQCKLGVEGAKVVAEMAAVSRSLSKVFPPSIQIRLCLSLFFFPRHPCRCTWF